MRALYAQKFAPESRTRIRFEFYRGLGENVVVAKSLGAFVWIFLSFACIFTAFCEPFVPIPARPELPLHRPTLAGEVCSLAEDLAVPEPPSVEYLTNVVACAGTEGQGHYVVLKSDGTLRAWGNNVYGQCNIPAGLSNIVAVETGNGFTLALVEDGTVFSWGDPAVVNLMPTNLTAVAIAAGSQHCMALRPDGMVTAWGHGYSSDGPQVTTPGTWTNIVAIAAGGFRSAALRADGVALADGEAMPDGTGSELEINGVNEVVDVSINEGSATLLKINGTVVFKGVTKSISNPFRYFKGPYPVSNITAVASAFNRALALRDDDILRRGESTIKVNRNRPARVCAIS
jgi:hypothetical protein